MANRILHQFNGQIDRINELQQFYNKSYLTLSGQMFVRLTEDQYCTFSDINGFFEVTGYELFGSTDTNSTLLFKIAKEYIHMASAAHIPISFHVVNSSGGSQLLFGAPQTKIGSLCSVMTGNISSLSMKPKSSLQDAVPTLATFQKFSGVIIGAGMELSPNLDMALNALESADYIFSIIANPCLQPEVATEVTRVNNYLDAYQVLSQRQITYGVGSRREVSHDNHDVLDLIDFLNSVKGLLGQSRSGGLWKTYISICAPDADSYSKAFSVFSSGLTASKTERGTPIPTPALLTTPYAPFRFGFWMLPDTFLGPINFGGLYSNSFDNLLPSDSISALLTLPSRPHQGIAIRQHGSSRESEYGAFSKYAPQVVAKDFLTLGTIAETGEQFTIPFQNLRQHTFIAGFTQCGKTTTTLQILSEAAKANIPFVVIESAKKQYCELLGKEQFAGSLCVYSGGYDSLLLRINPFQPEFGTILDNHIQSLVALLTSLFDEQAPLPQILNLLVYKAYDKKGWSPKDRIRHSERREFPTITTMIELIDEVVDEIGYSTKYSETADNMKGVIRGRLTSIIQGAMNDVLNSGANISIRQMFSTSAIVELDDFSETNKTFVAGLLALKTYEFSRGQDYGTDTRRLLVIEEAHNIVPNVDAGSVNANVALSSKHFSSMLAEVAAYGTGLIIIDQRPTAVSSAVIANTGIKIIHNLQAGEDKEAVSVSMGLTDTEKHIISDLEVGQAIVKIPNAPEKCRVNVVPASDKSVSVNWADLFLKGADRQGAVCEPIVSEVSFLDANISPETMKQCVAFAEMRTRQSFSLTEKIRYAGLLLNAINVSIREKRQLLCELVEMLGGDF